MKYATNKTITILTTSALFIATLPFARGTVSKAEGNHGIENPRIVGLAREIIEFGHYWKEDTNGDGKTDENDTKMPIRWQALEKSSDEVLLMADKILDYQKYNPISTDSSTWENCTLRTWLNSDFYKDAFSSAERTKINSKKDNVFLLSLNEIKTYGFNSDYSNNDQARIGTATAYAKEKGLSVSGNGAGFWWLRSPGNADYTAAYVNKKGNVKYNGRNIKYGCGVRPVIRINLSALSSGCAKDAGIKSVSVTAALWDTVTFGNYNGFALTWRVLSVNGDDAFLLSDRIIANKAYNDSITTTTWKDCTLRAWLNNDFYNSAFSNDEKAMIKDTNITNENNLAYGTTSGDNTTDKIYLLSLSEVFNTSYGFADSYKNSDTRAAYSAVSTDASTWWLRSPGSVPSSAAYVGGKGSVDNHGNGVDNTYGIRPVLHINLSSSAWTKGEKSISRGYKYFFNNQPTANRFADRRYNYSISCR